jgi:N-acyl-D-aspartate/D-glutamate deacylase
MIHACGCKRGVQCARMANKVLSFEEAVRRVTSDPADFFGIKERERIAQGKAADIVVFDPSTIASGRRPERLPAAGSAW